MDWLIRLINAVFSGLTQLTTSAATLGQLSAQATWAFFTLILIGYIFYTMKTQKEAAQMILEARIKDAEADSLMAQAVDKLADQIKELRYRMDKNGMSNV